MKAHYILLLLCLLLACGREAEQIKATQERSDFNDELVRGFSSLAVNTPLKSTVRFGSLVIIPNPDEAIEDFAASYPNWDEVLNNPVLPLSYQGRLSRAITLEDSPAEKARKLALWTLAISEFKDETLVPYRDIQRKNKEVKAEENLKFKDRIKALPCFIKAGDEEKLCYGKKGRDGTFSKVTLRSCSEFVVYNFADLTAEQTTESEKLKQECSAFIEANKPEELKYQEKVLDEARTNSSGNLANILGQLKPLTGVDHVAHIFSEEKKGNSCPPGLTECVSRVVLSADKTKLEDMELFMEFGGLRHFSVKNGNLIKPTLHVRTAWNGRPLYILAFGLYFDKDLILQAQLEMTLREDLGLRLMGTVTMNYPNQVKRGGYMKLEADFE